MIYRILLAVGLLAASAALFASHQARSVETPLPREKLCADMAERVAPGAGFMDHCSQP